MTTIAQEWGNLEITDNEMLEQVQEWFSERMMELVEGGYFLAETDEPEDKIVDIQMERIENDNGWYIAVTTINNQGDEVDIAIELSFTREQLYHWDCDEYYEYAGGTKWELYPSNNLVLKNPPQ